VDKRKVGMIGHIFKPVKEILSFVSLAVGIFLTLRDKFQWRLDFVSEITKVPFLGSFLVFFFGSITILFGMLVIRRTRPSSLVSGYQIPYYSPRLRQRAKMYVNFSLFLVPFFGLLLIVFEIYRQSLSSMVRPKIRRQ